MLSKAKHPALGRRGMIASVLGQAKRKHSRTSRALRIDDEGNFSFPE